MRTSKNLKMAVKQQEDRIIEGRIMGEQHNSRASFHDSALNDSVYLRPKTPFAVIPPVFQTDSTPAEFAPAQANLP